MKKVSLYIPCHNEARHLEAGLQMVLQQTYPLLEVLVIDDGSTDATADILARFPVKHVRIEERKGLSFARNIAIKEAQGDFIAALDADCVPDKSWLENIMANFKDEKTGGVGGRLIERQDTLINLWRSGHMGQEWGEKRVINPRFLYGSNTVFRKKVLRDIGLYNEQYQTNYEDVDISERIQKAGFSLIYEPKAVAFHCCADTLSSLVNRYWRWNFNFYEQQGYYLDFKRLCLKINDNAGLCYRLIEEDLKSEKPYLLYFDFFIPTALIFKDLIYFYQAKFKVANDYNQRLVSFVGFLDILNRQFISQGKDISLLSQRYRFELMLCKLIMTFGQYLKHKYPRKNFYKVWLSDMVNICFGESRSTSLFMSLIEIAYSKEELLENALQLDDEDRQIQRCFIDKFEQLFTYSKLELISNAVAPWVMYASEQDQTVAEDIIESSSFLFEPASFGQFKEDCDYYYSRVLNFPLMPPKMIQFDFMRRCQLQCKICKIWSKEATKAEEELKYEDMRSLADQAVEIGIKTFYISGGEPFLLPYLIEILQYAKEKGLQTEIATNGELLTEQKSRQIIAIGLDHIDISIDGACAATHDYHRNKTGLFEIIARNIQILNELKMKSNSSNPRIFICFVVTNKNFEEMLDFVKLAQRWGVEAFFQPYVSENNDTFYRAEEPDEFSIPKDRLPLLCDEVDKVIRYKEETNKVSLVTNTIRSLEALKDYFSGILQPLDYCYAGFSRIHILKDNKVNLCPGDIGNFKTDSLKDILHSDKAKEIRYKTIHCTKPCFIAAAYYPGPSLGDIFLIVKKYIISLQKEDRCHKEALSAMKKHFAGYKVRLSRQSLFHELNKIELIERYLEDLGNQTKEAISCRQ